MLQLFKKRINKDSNVAVCLDNHAVTVARVKRDRGMAPLLELCELQEIENQSLRGAEIARLTNIYHLDNFECISTLELGDYNLLLVEAPDVQPEELRAAIRWRVKDLIDFHIDDAVVDVFEVPNQKTAGKNRLMYAVVARADVIKHNIDLLTGAGLNLNVIDIPELALRNIASLLPEDVGGVAMVYIGDHYGLITITRQSTLYFSRRIDIGLNGLPDTTRSDSTVKIQRWLDGIIVEIQRSLDYYESHFSQPQVSAIVISPLGREVPGMLDYLSSQVDVPVRILNVNELIDVDTPVSEEMQSKCMLAIGAALRQESVTL